jgi:arylsulfate sulfotransferase
MKFRFSNYLYLFFFIIIACSKPRMTVISAGILPDNPLKFYLELETLDSTEIILDYWSTTPENALHKISKLATRHVITLSGLEPSTPYIYKLKMLKKGRVVYETEKAMFKTGTMPERVMSLVVEKQYPKPFEGHLLIRRFDEKGSNILINPSGKAVWYQEFDTTVLHPFAWTERQTVLSLQDSFIVAEHDLDGNQLLELDLKEKGFEFPIHHELIYHPNGNLLALSSVEKIYDLSKKGLSKTEKVKADALFLFDKDGKKLWEWSTFDVANPADDPKIKEYYQDWGHANSVSLDRDGNYLISFRDFSQVWKIDANDGHLIWKLGKGGDFKMPESAHFIAQHGAHINSEGHLMLFDNGDAKIRPYSRVLSFAIDEEKKIAEPQLLIDLSKDMTSYRMGSAYLIAPERILVCVTRKDATIAIMTSTGEILWQMRTGDATYRAYHIPNAFVEKKPQ